MERPLTMPYITSLERYIREEGRKEGIRIAIEKGLAARFGEQGERLFLFIERTNDRKHLERILDVMWTAQALDEIEPAVWAVE
jgi:hypothetical protein